MPLYYLIHIVVGVGSSWVGYWTWCWYRWKSLAFSGRLPPVCMEPQTDLPHGPAVMAAKARRTSSGASATYSEKSQSRLCYWHQCHSQSQQNPSQKPTLHAWALLRFHLSYLKTATNQRRSWESSWYQVSLMNLTYPESCTIRSNQREGMAGKHLMSNIHFFFLNLKYNL